MPPSALNHIALNCQNLAAQESFFCKHFGFKRSRTFNAGQPNEFIMLKLGSVRLELFPTATTAGEQGGEQTIGFKHLALDVPNLEEALEALRADGIKPDPIIDQPHVVPGMRIVFFRDPEGNIIELMEGYQDEA
ncbi:MAG TPA: VOC family protein [Chthoniobacterales bacterium]